MPPTPSLSTELRDFAAKESARIQESFVATGDGRAALLGRTALIETIVQRLWTKYVSPELDGPAGFAAVALGGFGRRWLFPIPILTCCFCTREMVAKQN